MLQRSRVDHGAPAGQVAPAPPQCVRLCRHALTHSAALLSVNKPCSCCLICSPYPLPFPSFSKCARICAAPNFSVVFLPCLHQLHLLSSFLTAFFFSPPFALFHCVRCMLLAQRGDLAAAYKVQLPALDSVVTYRIQFRSRAVWTKSRCHCFHTRQNAVRPCHKFLLTCCALSFGCAFMPCAAVVAIRLESQLLCAATSHFCLNPSLYHPSLYHQLEVTATHKKPSLMSSLMSPPVSRTSPPQERLEKLPNLLTCYGLERQAKESRSFHKWFFIAGTVV